MATISIDEFKRVEIRIGKVLEAERLKGTDKIIRLKVSFGDRTMQALTGLGHLYEPEHFIGKYYAFVTNLQPKKLRGEVSECMILAAVETEDKITPLTPETPIREGSQVM